MASSAAALSANSCIRFLNNGFYRKQQTQNLNFFKIRASSTEQGDDCNVEECAPDKEVGKVSMEWLAGEKTKVAGTFPPRKRDWSGYVEKDTAGQTNIYSVEPAVYVAESAISSGNSGTSADGAENTAAVVGFGGLIAVAAASVILLQVGKNQPPQINKPFDYAGPSLSHYITKFKPSEIIVQTQVDSAQVSDTVMSSTSAENAETVVIPETVMSSTSAETQETVVVPQIDSEAPSETVTSTASTENSESGVATPEALQVEVGSG